MYDDVVFGDRLRYALAMHGNRVLIVLSRLILGHIACEIDADKSPPHFAEFPIVCKILCG